MQIDANSWMNEMKKPQRTVLDPVTAICGSTKNILFSICMQSLCTSQTTTHVQTHTHILNIYMYSSSQVLAV